MAQRRGRERAEGLFWERSGRGRGTARDVPEGAVLERVEVGRNGQSAASGLGRGGNEERTQRSARCAPLFR